MTVSQLIELLNKAQARTGPEADVILCFEPATIEDGFDWEHTEGVSDVRLVEDWPLPGESLVAYEGDKTKKIVLFYDNHFALDSSKE